MTRTHAAVTGGQTHAGIPGRRTQAGFTLLEIILVLGILATISVMSITMLSTQLTQRNKLELINQGQHAVNLALDRIYDDMRAIYLYNNETRVIANLPERAVKPGLTSRAGATWFLTQAFRSLRPNSPESDLAAVRYYERPNPQKEGRKQLVRAVDTDLKESIERDGVGTDQVLVDDLKEFKLAFWDGSDFREDWDTNTGDSQNKLPKMIRIRLSAYMPISESEEQMRSLRENGAGGDGGRDAVDLETIAYLLSSSGAEQAKEASKEYSWR